VDIFAAVIVPADESVTKSVVHGGVNAFCSVRAQSEGFDSTTSGSAC